MKVEFMPHGSPEGDWSFSICGLDAWEIGMILWAMELAAGRELADSADFKALFESIREQSDRQTNAYRRENES